MVFNSLQYFLFLPVVWLCHYFIGQRFRCFFLLVASLLFYASLRVPYLLVVITLVTLSTYVFGLWISRSNRPENKKRLLIFGIATNTLILVTVKYLPFLTFNFNKIFSYFGSSSKLPHVQLFVAVGVSYYIFQAISYLIDIYLEIEKPETNMGYFALYMVFFPKLLQGPIERSSDFLPQLKHKYEFNYENMRLGLLLFGWGLFKKVVLADRFGLYVDNVYNDLPAYEGVTLWFATYAYAFQIYFDFSGYTDMALGTARLFNIKLTNNFNSPYLATSVAEFWRRWHITFSRWILDYIFKPLQMSWRNWKNWGTAAALMVTFFISGLWHGASYGFVVWGVLHGLYMAFSLIYRPYQKKIHKMIGIQNAKLIKAWKIFLTFHLVCFAWIFFRAETLLDAWYVVSNSFDIPNIYHFITENNHEIILKLFIFLSENNYDSIKLFFSLLVYLLVMKNAKIDFFRKTIIFRWSCYYGLLIVILLFWVKATPNFIYFNY